MLAGGSISDIVINICLGVLTLWVGSIIHGIVFVCVSRRYCYKKDNSALYGIPARHAARASVKNKQADKASEQPAQQLPKPAGKDFIVLNLGEEEKGVILEPSAKTSNLLQKQISDGDRRMACSCLNF